MTKDIKKTEDEFKVGVYQLTMIPKSGEGSNATCSQSGSIESQDQLTTWFNSVSANQTLPDSHEYVFVHESNDKFDAEYGSTRKPGSANQRTQGTTTDPHQYDDKAVSRPLKKEAVNPLLAGLQGSNPSDDAVRSIQKNINLNNMKRDFETESKFKKHVAKFVQKR